MKIFTIGFTQTSAENFFERLRKAGVQRVVDTRLNNVSQLAGFAKRDDLEYFLRKILGIEYIHAKELAPEDALLESYRKKTINWADYEKAYRALIAARRVEETLSRTRLDQSCLLCSEAEARHCHRRLAVEYLREKWGDLEIIHL